VILGEPDAARAGGTTAGLTARLLRRNAEAARTSDPEAATGKVVDIVRHVADVLAAFGERLSGGDIVIAGSVLPPALVEADETGITYALDPIGTVSVAFTR
jgi:2-keto-4-pentenoate hydratase